MSEPSEEQKPPPEFTSVHAVAWVMSAFFVLVGASTILYGMRPESGADLVSLGTLSSAVFLLMAALLLGKYPGGSRALAAIGARPISPLLIGLGFLMGACAQVPADRLRRLVEYFAPLPEGEANARLELLQPSSVGHAVVLALVAVLLVPWAEEVFFRGAVFGALRRSGRSSWVAAAVTGLGFTLSHFDARLWLAILFVAGLLGFTRALSGSLWPGFALHVGFNGVTIASSIAQWAGKSEGLELSLAQELVGGGVLALCFVLFWLVAQRSPLSRSARRAEERVEALPSPAGERAGE